MRYFKNFIMTIYFSVSIISSANAETVDTLSETKAIVAIMMETLKTCEDHACTMKFYNQYASADLLSKIAESDANTKESMLKAGKPMAVKFLEDIDKFDVSIEKISEDKVFLVYKAKEVNNKQENKFSFVKINGEWKLG